MSSLTRLRLITIGLRFLGPSAARLLPRPPVATIMRPTARRVDASEVLSRAVSHYNFRKPCESQYRAQAGGGHKHKAGRLTRRLMEHRLLAFLAFSQFAFILCDEL
jgi:hypothetical protein